MKDPEYQRRLRIQDIAWVTSMLFARRCLAIGVDPANVEAALAELAEHEARSKHG